MLEWLRAHLVSKARRSTLGSNNMDIRHQRNDIVLQTITQILDPNK